MVDTRQSATATTPDNNNDLDDRIATLEKNTADNATQLASIISTQKENMKSIDVQLAFLSKQIAALVTTKESSVPIQADGLTQNTTDSNKTVQFNAELENYVSGEGPRHSSGEDTDDETSSFVEETQEATGTEPVQAKGKVNHSKTTIQEVSRVNPSREFDVVTKDEEKEHDDWMKQFKKSPTHVLPSKWNGKPSTYYRFIISVAQNVHMHYSSVNQAMKVNDHLQFLRKCTLGKSPVHKQRKGMYHHIWTNMIDPKAFQDAHTLCTATEGIGIVLEEDMKLELKELKRHATSAVTLHHWEGNTDAKAWAKQLQELCFSAEPLDYSAAQRLEMSKIEEAMVANLPPVIHNNINELKEWKTNPGDESAAKLRKAFIENVRSFTQVAHKSTHNEAQQQKNISNTVNAVHSGNNDSKKKYNHKTNDKKANSDSKNTKKAKGECFYCKVTGHYASECTVLKKDIKADTVREGFDMAKFNKSQERRAAMQAKSKDDVAKVNVINYEPVDAHILNNDNFPCNQEVDDVSNPHSDSEDPVLLCLYDTGAIGTGIEPHISTMVNQRPGWVQGIGSKMQSCIVGETTKVIDVRTKEGAFKTRKITYTTRWLHTHNGSAIIPGAPLRQKYGVEHKVVDKRHQITFGNGDIWYGVAEQSADTDACLFPYRDEEEFAFVNSITSDRKLSPKVQHDISVYHRTWMHPAEAPLRNIIRVHDPQLYKDAVKREDFAPVCIPCKTNRDTKKGKIPRATKFGHMHHVDIHELPCLSPEKWMYLIGFTDDFIPSMRFVYGAKRKFDIVTCVSEHIARVKSDYGIHIHTITGDQEFVKNSKLKELCTKVLVTSHPSHRPWQSIQENSWKHLLRRARCALQDMDGHTTHFAHAVIYAADIGRITPDANGDVPEIIACTADKRSIMERKVKSRMPPGPFYSTCNVKMSAQWMQSHFSGQREPGPLQCVFLGFKHNISGYYMHFWNIPNHLNNYLACVTPASVTFTNTGSHQLAFHDTPYTFMSPTHELHKSRENDVAANEAIVMNKDVERTTVEETDKVAEEGEGAATDNVDKGESVTDDVDKGEPAATEDVSLGNQPTQRPAEFRSSNRVSSRDSHEETKRAMQSMQFDMHVNDLTPKDSASVNYVRVINEHGRVYNMTISDATDAVFASIMGNSSSVSNKTKIPRSAQEAVKSDTWAKSMQREWEGIEKHTRLSSLAEYEREKKNDDSIILMQTTWVFAERESKEYIEKSRLCARSDLHNLDNLESAFSSSVAREFARVQVMHAAIHGKAMRLGDCKQAFLSVMRKDVGAPRMWMKVWVPVIQEDGSYILTCIYVEVYCVIYGERMAGAYFQRGLAKCFHAGGLVQSKVDACVFHTVDASTYRGHVTITTNTDDLLFTGDKEAVDAVFKYIQQHFKLVDVDFTKYLGMNIIDNDEGVHMCQSSFIDKILTNEEYEEVCGGPISRCGDAATPIVEALHAPVWVIDNVYYPEKVVVLDDAKAKVYRSMVGACLYLVWTRADIKVALSQLSRHMARPTEVTWAALKRLLRYLKGTRELGLWMPRNGTIKEDDGHHIKLYVDASHASQVSRTSTKSVSGYVIMIDDVPVAFQTAKQSLTSVSSTESEVLALCDGILAVRAIEDDLNDLLNVHGGYIDRITVYCDNTSAIILCRDRNSSTAKTRHFSIRQSVCREYFGNNAIRKLEHITTEEQIADMFTKPLPATKFKYFRGFVVVFPGGVSEEEHVKKDVRKV